MLDDLGRYVGADKAVDDEWRRHQIGDETTPLERRDICDDDLRKELQAASRLVRTRDEASKT